jgi:hypothetical protein
MLAWKQGARVTILGAWRVSKALLCTRFCFFQNQQGFRTLVSISWAAISGVASISWIARLWPQLALHTTNLARFSINA